MEEVHFAERALGGLGSRGEGSRAQYFKLRGDSVSFRAQGAKGWTWMTSSVADVLKTTFLPVGFPHSVRPEYASYQFWDSLQGLSSYLRSVLATRSVLAGAGVGSAEATPLAAALTWVFRDGLGMVGSLAFAYTYCDAFEVYIKEWRYAADCLNNIGLTLDLLSADFPHYYTLLSSVSTICKACCGLIAGATKARISAHFALPGHLADVSAKESTQETAVALTGLLLGMALARVIGDDALSVWGVFLLLLGVHQVSNYFLVRSLVFNSLNPQRCYLLVADTIGQMDERQGSSGSGSCGDSGGSGSGGSGLGDKSSVVKRAGGAASSAYSTRSSSRSSSTREIVRIGRLPTPKDIALKEGFMLPLLLSMMGPVVGGSVGGIVEGLQIISRYDGAGTGVGARAGIAAGEGAGMGTRAGTATRAGTGPKHKLTVGQRMQLLASTFQAEEFLLGLSPSGRVL
eukprot:CAMPEP_0173342014 /NCGR_PEP_ID=MMETSP1144-20121109/9936_1 /TAXON_ID=483371 /ORGANISM="non described non described, Strain CCMP2298" /LENGTH=457 /DNA_ID=CAMNT_0014288489 /DNA_START=90 /DNA_END=1459 /DNA_ORIENTATION=+